MNPVLMAVVVLPSEGWLEVTRIVFGGVPADESSSDVRRWRYDSAIGERTSVTIASAVVSLGFNVSAPRRRLSLRTDGTKARTKAIMMLRSRAGPTSWGVRL